MTTEDLAHPLHYSGLELDNVIVRYMRQWRSMPYVVRDNMGRTKKSMMSVCESEAYEPLQSKYVLDMKKIL